MDKVKGQPQTIPEAKSVLSDPNILIGIVVALIVVIISFLLLRTRKRGRSILLVGPSESGKTAIFAHLTVGKGAETVTSIVPNETEYVCVKGSLTIKDLPGHDRVRNKFWEAHKAGMRGIICVIDAAGGNKAIRDAAEVIYWVLTDSLVNSVRPNILIFANKQDQPTAKGGNLIRTQLEREITTLRLTKSASLETTDGNATVSSKTLGKPNRDFEFDHVAPILVDFAEGSAKTESPELTQIIKWLEQVA